MFCNFFYYLSRFMIGFELDATSFVVETVFRSPLLRVAFGRRAAGPEREAMVRKTRPRPDAQFRH